MFSEYCVAENHPTIKAVCVICKKTSYSIACMNNMHLGLVGGVQNYKCQDNCADNSTTPQIILKNATWEAAWLNSELGKVQAQSAENISPATAGDD